MSYPVELSNLALAMIPVIVAIPALRLLFFHKAIEDLESKCDSKSTDNRDELNTQITSGKGNIDKITELVNRQSVFDRTKGNLETLDNSMSNGFVIDFVAIALLVLAYITASLGDMNTTDNVVLSVFGFGVALDIYNFVGDGRTFHQIRKSLRH